MAATAELTRLDAAIERGTRRLLELQGPDGIWVGELESNVTMTAQHLYWNHYLGLRTPDLDRRIAKRAGGGTSEPLQVSTLQSSRNSAK